MPPISTVSFSSVQSLFHRALYVSWLPYKFWAAFNPFLLGVLVWIAAESEVGNSFNREHRVFPVLPLPALIAGAFLLPALSPADRIPVVQAGSCSAALHCDEFSTDVFLLSTLPVLLFSPACLQPWCSRFLNMCSTFVLLFSILLLNLRVLFLHVFFLFVCVRVHIFSYYAASLLTIPMSQLWIWVEQYQQLQSKFKTESLYIFRMAMNKGIIF